MRVITPAAKGGMIRLSSKGKGKSSMKVAIIAPTKMIRGLIPKIGVNNKPISEAVRKKERLPSMLLPHSLFLPLISPTKEAMGSPKERKRMEIIAISFLKTQNTNREERRRKVLPVSPLVSCFFRATQLNSGNRFITGNPRRAKSKAK